MSQKRITIEDIAREAGVGIGTVSRVLNNSIHVSEKTRKRVLDVIKARQFKPSGAARILARQNRVDSSIGLLLPDIGNHYFFEIFEAIYRKLRGLGIDLIILNYEKHNPQVIQRVLDAQVSALLIFALKLDEEEHQLLSGRNVRYLYIDYPRERDHCIYTDNVLGGELAGRYLLDKGIKNPCYIGVDPPAQSNIDRYKGFCSIYNDVPTFSSALSEEAGYAIALEVMASGQYDGVFCYCDDIASGFVQAVREKSSPMRVIGFDGVRATKYLNLSTISQEPGTIGTKAASRIVDIMRAKEEPEPIIECIKPVLIDRGS